MDLNKFLSSNLHFNKDEHQLQSRYTLINISLILSIVALIYGDIHNFIVNSYYLFYLEMGIVFINISLFFILRIKKEYFDTTVTILSLEYLLFFVLLILFGNPNDLKYIWIFTYPFLLLYLKQTRGLYWIFALIVAICITKIQPFYPTAYSWYQISYIELSITVITIIVQLYKLKIDENERIINKQHEQIQHYTHQLSEKERLLVMQSRQAAMGEMIQMIAHQWRQPLSTITLQISNLHFKALLHDTSKEEILKTLDGISDTIVYLADTIDDFQTYFRHDKQIQRTDACEIVTKAIGFIKPRLDAKKITIHFTCKEQMWIQTVVNELIQVLINIINNSIDALMQNGIESAWLKVAIEQNENATTLIKISDNAGGIPEDIIDKIFDPYFSTKGKNGNGIGLYMSKMLIENQLQGNIHVSNTAEGALFTLKLPTAPSLH